MTLVASATSVSGSLTANGTTFTNECCGNSSITFTPTATLSGGTNTFNLPISVPYTLVPSLAGNTSFDEVEIQAATLSSGTLSLNLLGTVTTNFFYEFPNGFTVAAGGTMAVGAGVPITVVSALTDAGAVSFSSGDAVTLAASATSVSGSLTANGTTFTNQCCGNSSITFTPTATLSGGTNTFNLPISVPYTLVPSLAGNTSFDVVEIQAATLSSGTLSLNLLGTVTTNFFYEFPNGFTVAAGGTMAVGAGVPITVVSALNDAGAVSFSSGDAVTFASSPTSVSGSLTANGTTFTNQCCGNSSITFTPTATLSGGTNTFNLPVSVPYTLVPSLAGNTSFDVVEIQAATLSSGTLSLNLLGTVTTNFFYEFPNGFTVAAGGTMAVGAGVPITVVSALNDAGAVSFSSGDAVTFASSPTSVSGSLTANGTTFTNECCGNSSIVLNSGGDLVASGSTFGVPLSLASGSTDNLQQVAFDTQLTINSGATINITSDDFTNGTVVASGSPSATISLINNFWGTLNTTQIAAKITDHTKNSSLPTVLYQPFLTEDATGTFASNATATFSIASQSIALSATVISAAGLVNTGTATFTVLNGSACRRHARHQQRRERRRKRRIRTAGLNARRRLHDPGCLQRNVQPPGLL